jgi:energy-coupling factor transport system permease protein
MQEILQYVHKDTLFHQLNTFTKIIFMVIVMIMSVLTTDVAVLFCMVFAILCLAWISSLHRDLLNQVPLIVVMTISLSVLTIFTMQTGTVIGYFIPAFIPYIGPAIPITWGALDFSAVLILRFVVLMFGFQLVITSTQPREIARALQKMYLPIDYTLMFLIALRFIPTLQLEGQRIHEAQLARGYNPGKGLLGKIRSLTPIMIPLVSNSLAKTMVLGLTIDLRGYRNGRKSVLRNQKFLLLDYGAVITMSIVSSAFIWYSFIRI